MLKITRETISDRDITLKLDGNVAGQWVELLRITTETIFLEGVELTLDLSNVNFIDCEGSDVVKSLLRRGARQVNAPLFVAELISGCGED